MSLSKLGFRQFVGMTDDIQSVRNYDVLADLTNQCQDFAKDPVIDIRQRKAGMQPSRGPAADM